MGGGERFATLATLGFLRSFQATFERFLASPIAIMLGALGPFEHLLAFSVYDSASDMLKRGFRILRLSSP